MRHLLSWFGHFRQLQWKLTFSYTLTTVCALSLVEILGLGLVYSFLVFDFPQLLLNAAQQEARVVSPYFAGTTIDSNMIKGVLAGGTSIQDAGVSIKGITIVVVDASGKVVAAQGENAAMLPLRLPAQVASDLHSMLTGEKKQPLTPGSYHNVWYAIAPIVGVDKRIRGAVLIEANQVTLPWNRVLANFLVALLISMIFFFFCAGIIGTIFGFLTARGFTRRFKHVSSVVDNWSQGDFSAFMQDSSGDELGQLARRLNRMAEQLQNLLQTRQKLATLEERNRLARDLHDSVKQEVFAVSMQVSTAKALLGRDIPAARERLNEAEHLVRLAQKELTSLIRELRPVALDGKGLVRALQELVNEWQHQTEIAATIDSSGDIVLSLIVEEALFRIAQEALSNVARHSHATAVQLQIRGEQDNITLSIIDNGRGFDRHNSDHQGIGLLSMKERIQALGGSIDIKSGRNQGTAIVVQCRQSTTDSGASFMETGKREDRL
jgi:signal transduction histidine kinase